jgi:hypothetical protein
MHRGILGKPRIIKGYIRIAQRSSTATLRRASVNLANGERGALEPTLKQAAFDRHASNRRFEWRTPRVAISS